MHAAPPFFTESTVRAKLRVLYFRFGDVEPPPAEDAWVGPMQISEDSWRVDCRSPSMVYSVIVG